MAILPHEFIGVSDRNDHKSFECPHREKRKKISVDILTTIEGGSTRHCDCVLRTLVGQSLTHLPVTRCNNMSYDDSAGAE